MSIKGAVGSLLTVGKGVHIFPESTNLYLDKLASRLKDVQIFKKAEISEVKPCPGGVGLLNGDDSFIYDSVVFACSANAAYHMLCPFTKPLFEPLNQINYVDTVAVVHSDERVRNLFGNDFGHFNYLGEDFATITWNITDLYGIHADQPIYLTAGPPALLDASINQFEMVIDINQYRHCVHTPASIDASESLKTINGFRSVHFAGSYLGFAPIHEAAVASAENVAATLLESVRK
jgi:predicted NAD/FAD-binding protein